MAKYKPLTLLHSNDMHGDFLAEDVDGKLVGGVSMLSGYINKVRAEEPNTLYCIAGDMFRGSVIDSEFQGISTIEIMNMLSPDVVTIGNHETDYGIAHLLFLEKCAKFPIINANLHVKMNHARLFRPYLVKAIDGMKILFIGILTEDVIAQTKKEELIGTFVDVGEAAAEVGRICNAYNAIDIDATVLLTHIGFEEDKKLAARLDPAWGVDMIIGGHSHTFMTEPAVVNGIPIVQAGVGTDQIGRFDLTVDTENNRIADFKWQCVPIDGTHCPADPDIARLIESYKHQTDEKYSRVITRLARRLTHPARVGSSDLGGLFADAIAESLGIDLMLLASGSVRSDSLGPIVMLQDLTECFPFDDAAYMVRLSGAQLRHILTFTVRDETWEGAHTEFYQLSKGWRFRYSREEQKALEFTFRGAPVQDGDLFTVGIQHYHFINMEKGMDLAIAAAEANGKARVLSTSCLQVIEEYLSEHPHLNSHAANRIAVI